MNPIEALNYLWNVAKRAGVDYDTHAQAQNAHAAIMKVLMPPPAREDECQESKPEQPTS